MAFRFFLIACAVSVYMVGFLLVDATSSGTRDAWILAVLLAVLENAFFQYALDGLGAAIMAIPLLLMVLDCMDRAQTAKSRRADRRFKVLMEARSGNRA